jgi:hypothetical protein
LSFSLFENLSHFDEPKSSHAREGKKNIQVASLTGQPGEFPIKSRAEGEMERESK